MANRINETVVRDENRDPITGAPGAHPVGVGVGAAGGGAAGAAIGAAVGGPIGAIAGGVVGAIAGGLTGKGVAEGIDPTLEHQYWRTNYASRPYVQKGTVYDEYGPAYQYGWESYSTYGRTGKRFDEIERDLERGWDTRRPYGRPWVSVKDAARDAWNRAETLIPGDVDGGGR